MSEEFIKCINSLVPKPDLTIILDLDPAVAMARVRQRGELEKFEQLTFLTKVRQIYLKRAVEEGYCVVDASRSPEEVALEVLNIVLKYSRGERGHCRV